MPNTIRRDGTFYVHVRIPKNHVDSCGGELFITKSLGTKDKERGQPEERIAIGAAALDQDLVAFA